MPVAHTWASSCTFPFLSQLLSPWLTLADANRWSRGRIHTKTCACAFAAAPTALLARAGG